jgi:hypothetical protein
MNTASRHCSVPLDGRSLTGLFKISLKFAQRIQITGEVIPVWYSVFVRLHSWLDPNKRVPLVVRDRMRRLAVVVVEDVARWPVAFRACSSANAACVPVRVLLQDIPFCVQGPSFACHSCVDWEMHCLCVLKSCLHPSPDRHFARVLPLT